MKLFFLMSDVTVIILALIPSLTTIAVLVITAEVNARIKKVEELQKIRIQRTEVGIQKIDQIAEKQDVIHKQIDGRMEDLLKINKEASEAIGKIKGAQEEKEKHANGHKNGEENSNQ